MRITALAITATLALAACGSDQSETAASADADGSGSSIDTESGEANFTLDTPEGEATLRAGPDVEVDLIDGFTLIEGAEVVSNTVVDTAAGKGAIVTFKSDKSPEGIAEHYRGQAEAAGIDIQIETAINGGKMLGGESESGTTFSITAYPTDDATLGQLTIGSGV